MVKSKVFFVPSRVKANLSPAEKFKKLIGEIGIPELKERSCIALKIHFGEVGATGYIHPTYVRTLVDYLKAKKFRPFLTDTNTLYPGPRSNGVDHYELAIRNGFGFETVGVPIVIADGIRSHSVHDLSAGPKYFKTVKIGNAIWESDALITLNHFKGHLVTSFGGAIKNLSMGCGSRATKQRMHADLKPELRKEACIGCGECVAICPVEAISLNPGGIARFDLKRCIGCAECLSVCAQYAIKIQWSGTSRSVQEKMAETALAVNRYFTKKSVHFNFLLNITPECDCMRWTDNPIVQNIGILASVDPVAIDQASLDLVTAQQGLMNSALPENAPSGEDKFALIHPGVDTVAQLRYGEEIGLGSRQYELIEI